MKRKAALQLSVNFLVTLVICIVVFSSSIYLIKKFFIHAETIKDTYDERTEKEIERLLDDGSKVAIPFDTKTIGNGEFKTFGIGILNMLDTGMNNNFQINIKFNKAYKDDNILLCESPCSSSGDPSPDTWLQTTSGPGSAGSGVSITKTIRNNEQEKFLLVVEPKKAPSGTYIFDLNVKYENITSTGNWIQYDTLHKLYVDVP